MSRTLLVTGGAGFIGCNLVRRILRETDEILSICTWEQVATLDEQKGVDIVRRYIPID